MITKFNEFNLIKESPDELSIRYKNGRVRYSHRSADAKPFFVEVNSAHTEVTKLFIGPYKGWHSDMRYSYFGERAYAGRIWTKLKIISFWVYPNKILFTSILRSLQEKLGIRIFNNDWKVEIIRTDQGIKRKEPRDPDVKYWPEEYYVGSRAYKKTNQEIIPIEDYVSSEDNTEELIAQHLLNWKEKEKEKKKDGVKGFGSAKTAWDKPNNIKWRQALYQENKNNK